MVPLLSNELESIVGISHNQIKISMEYLRHSKYCHDIVNVGTAFTDNEVTLRMGTYLKELLHWHFSCMYTTYHCFRYNQLQLCGEANTTNWWWSCAHFLVGNTVCCNNFKKYSHHYHEIITYNYLSWGLLRAMSWGSFLIDNENNDVAVTLSK